MGHTISTLLGRRVAPEVPVPGMYLEEALEDEVPVRRASLTVPHRHRSPIEGLYELRRTASMSEFSLRMLDTPTVPPHRPSWFYRLMAWIDRKLGLDGGW